MAYVTTKPEVSNNSSSSSTNVKDEASKIDIGKLVNELKKLLPEHMVPVAFVRLEKIPLTPNDKVDRKALHALPRPDQSAFANEEIYVAPSTEIEKQLVSVWQGILNPGKDEKGVGITIGIKANFFSLGGSSLSVAKLQVKMRESFKVKLNISALFDNPTIESQAVLIVQQARAVKQSSYSCN